MSVEWLFKDDKKGSMMNTIVAQGVGYYGLALFTSPLSMDQFKVVFGDEPGFKEVEGLHGSPRGYSLFYPPDTQVMIMPTDLAPQPKPVVVFDTGHGPIDLHILNHLYQLLKTSNFEWAVHP